MNTKNLAIVVMAVVLVAALSYYVYYATRPAPRELVPTPSDTLVWAEDITGVTTFDPGETYSGFNTGMVHYMYDQLITHEGSDFSNPVGEAAESWTVSDDGLVWTFKLREGMKFTGSGNEVTAKDVVYSFNRVVDMVESPAFVFTQLGMTNTSTVALDDYTVQVTLGQKWAKTIVEQSFANWVGSIVDSEVVKSKEVDGDFGSAWLDEHSEGSGPYVLTTFEEESKLVLDWNENYWKWSSETKVRDPPQIKKLIVQSVTESATRRLMLEKGDVDVVVGLDENHLDELSDLEGFDIKHSRTPSYRGLIMMVLPEYDGQPNPVTDNRVRDAVRYSIDYDAIVDSIYLGFAKKMQTIIGSDLPGYMPLTPYYKDPAKAKSLLEEAGYPNGFTLNIMFRDTGDYRSLAEKLQSDLADSGITVNFEIVSAAESRARIRSREFQSTITGFGLDYMDPDAAATAFAHCTSLGSDAPVQLNAWRAGWVNETVSAWVDEARITSEWEDRAPLYEKIQEAVLYNGPYAIILEKPYRYQVTRSWVENHVNHPQWSCELEVITKQEYM